MLEYAKRTDKYRIQNLQAYFTLCFRAGFLLRLFFDPEDGDMFLKVLASGTTEIHQDLPSGTRYMRGFKTRISGVKK
jgi:hypothetical protein